MKSFKLPLIITVIVVTLTLLIGLAVLTWIFNLDVPDREQEQRAGMVGSILATLMCLVIGPFWLFAAAQFGKQKREQASRR